MSSIVIGSNIAAINSQRHLGKTQAARSKSMENLASGLRLNSAKDDAAGLAISTGMSAQIRGLGQAVRNGNDGISLAQTAEGGIGDTINVLQRMRELALQAANDTYSDQDRANLEAEFDELKKEVDKIANNKSYNDTTLLDGSFTDMAIHVGENSNEGITLNIESALAEDIPTPPVDNLNISNITIATEEGAQKSIEVIDSAMLQLTETRSNLGAFQNRVTYNMDNLLNVQENVTDARSQITDADIAYETARLTSSQIIAQSGTAMLAAAIKLPEDALALLP
ncbi:Flagellin [Candidatus Magnetomoraceae bacterium gMMP-15]